MQLPVLRSAVAVISQVPIPLQVTVPSWLTVATAVFDDFHVTVLSVALSGLTVAISLFVAPTSTSAVYFAGVTVTHVT